MTIRDGTPDDIPAIVDLLRKSLGEDLMPKTEAFWNWKHVQNPFGASDVLLAWEDELLVGVRAFMRWEWANRDRVIRAVRAVDTATHPDYQGKGIFSKLTLALIEKCKSDSVDFIFNTPNKKSRPGYLKMGWKKVGRLPIRFRLAFPPGSKRGDFEETYRWSEDWLKSYAFTKTPQVTTHRTASYYRWRYGSNPNVRYHVATGDGYAIIFRLKPHRAGIELRICDVHVEPGAVARQKQVLAEVVRNSGAFFITWSGSPVHQASFLLPAGPMLTWYPLSWTDPLTFAEWMPTLGDLEVF